MKAMFLVNAPANVEMFIPIIRKLPSHWDSLIVNMDKWSQKVAIERRLQESEVSYRTMDGWKRRDVDKLLEETKPSVIVMPHDTAIPVDSTFINCAHTKNISTLYLPHGLWFPKLSATDPYGAGIYNRIKYCWIIMLGLFRLMRNGKVSHRYLADTWWLWAKDMFSRKLESHGGCSKLAVFGDSNKEFLTASGINPNRIVVMGNPKFDYLFHSNGRDCKLKICQKYGIAEHKDIVLLLTGYFVEYGYWTSRQRQQFIMAIYKACLRLPQSKLIIKLHPIVENIATYEGILEGVAEPPIVCQDERIWELIHASSVVLTVHSGGGLEAMAAGKPLVVVNLFGNAVPFDKTDGVTVVEDETELLSVLARLLNHGLSPSEKERTDKFVYHNAYTQDGKASERLAKLIVQMGHNYGGN